MFRNHQSLSIVHLLSSMAFLRNAVRPAANAACLARHYAGFHRAGMKMRIDP